MKLKLKNERGYTLQELLVTIPLSMLILGGVTNTFITQSRSYHAQEKLTEMQQNARAAIDLMTREIMMAGYDPTGAAFPGITYDTNQLQIIADLDGDGDTTANTELDERIIYSYDNANDRILRNEVNGGAGYQPLAENIDDFDYSYLDAAGMTTTVTADIRQIQVTIIARTSAPDPNYPDNGGYRIYTLTSFITPRNLAN